MSEGRRAVQVVEAGPRDGFQSVKEYIPFETKLEIVRRICRTGVKKVQLTSFVSPRAVPQMKDAGDLVAAVLPEFPELELYALVPNFKGAQRAAESGLKEISTVISLSEAHNKANVGKTVEESLAELDRILQGLPQLQVELDIATAFGCPFLGDIPTERLLALMDRLYTMGIRSFDLCDTTGMAWPGKVREVLKQTKAAFPQARIGLHIHDSRNMGMLNSFVGLEAGADFLQAALGGLGGCPFAPGASGNTATEDLVYLLEREGYDTGINFEALLDAARYQFSQVRGNYSGHHVRMGTCCEEESN